MKENIILLREEGKSYREIQKILGCSKSTIAFHCGAGQKEKCYKRRNILTANFRKSIKEEHGGKCALCGYSKCLAALEFHHKEPNNKIGTVSDVLMANGMKAAREEANKCVLMCANCHRESHFSQK